MYLYADAQQGNDRNCATAEKPLKTLEAIRDLAARRSRETGDDVTVFLRGTFRLADTLTFRPEHSGTPGHPICYTSWGAERAVITMADTFTGFTLHDAPKNIWKIYVGEGIHTRQAYFNGIRGIRARTVGYLKQAQYVDGSYYLCDNRELLTLKYPREVDMVYHINWCNPRYLIDSIEPTPEGRVKIVPHPHFSRHKGRIDFAGPGRIDATPGYLENAYEFLSQPGQWYLDRHAGYLYYIPRPGEDMQTMSVQLPLGEVLIHAAGADEFHPLTDLEFEDLCFEGTTWLKVDRDGGFHDAQNGHIREGNDVLDDRAPGEAIHFENCRRIRMENNVFRRFGVTGVGFMGGSKHVDFIGNELYDISGVGLTVDDIGLTGFPDQRSPGSLCEFIRVEHNYIHSVALDYKSSAAISFAWPRHSRFNHNEICAVPYSGFHIGYGWDKYAETGSVLFDTEVNFNYVHDVFTDRVFDGGCIYTLGASSLECEKTNTARNNRMIGNFVANSWTCAMIYPDEGSTCWYVRDNVIDQSRVKFLENNLEDKAEKSPWAVHMHASSIQWMTFENNYATCDYAYRYNMMNQRESVVAPMHMLQPGAWESWPAEARQIMENAGIGEAYRKNFRLDGPKVLVCDDRRQSLSLEKPIWAGFSVLGGKNRTFDIKDYAPSLWMDDPDAVTLTADGYYIAHKKGTFEGEVAATFAGRTFLHHVKLDCGDEIEELRLNVDSLRLIRGTQVQLRASARSTFGNVQDITAEAQIELTAADDLISLSFTQDRSALVVSSCGQCGSSFLSGTIRYKDICSRLCVPVAVVEYAPDLPVPAYSALEVQSGWKNAGTPTPDGGLKVCGSPNHLNRQLQGGIYAFDLQIHPGNSHWPSIAICDSDFMGSYNTNHCYMFMFLADRLELVRFNHGVRTVIFGANGTAVSGPARSAQGLYAYHQRHRVLLGAQPAEGGTRLYLRIDGQTVLDYTDTDSNRLHPFGYLVVYTPESADGGMTFWPYSGPLA